MKCRHCYSRVTFDVLDLGAAPPSNAYLSSEALSAPELWLPLRLRVCETCWLVQTEDFSAPDAFFSSNYAYFSSISASWPAHAARYAKATIERFGLTARALVCEVAANDGYLLRYFVEAGVPCYGIEPTASTAAAARRSGLDIVEAFFGTTLATKLLAEGRAADLIVANNVLAHVPDINDFVRGFAMLLTPSGVASFEFPHVLRMVRHDQFDTVYHEHFSYLSFTTVMRVLATNGLCVFDVEELPTHGGSLRVFAQRADTGARRIEPAVAALRSREALEGIDTRAFYSGFQARAETIKNDLLTFLIDAKRAGQRVAAYGAAAKGNTLLNFAGVRPDLIGFVVDRAPSKQGCFMPGSRIPIVSEERLVMEKPNYVLILPWNLREELLDQLDHARSWGARFVTAVPDLQVS